MRAGVKTANSVSELQAMVSTVKTKTAIALAQCVRNKGEPPDQGQLPIPQHVETGDWETFATETKTTFPPQSSGVFGGTHLYCRF